MGKCKAFPVPRFKIAKAFLWSKCECLEKMASVCKNYQLWLLPPTCLQGLANSSHCAVYNNHAEVPGCVVVGAIISECTQSIWPQALLYILLSFLHSQSGYEHKEVTEKNLREDLNAVLYSPPPTCHTQVHAVGGAPTLGGQWNTARRKRASFHIQDQQVSLVQRKFLRWPLRMS